MTKTALITGASRGLGFALATALAEVMPGADLSQTPAPEEAAAALLRLLETRAPSGRYRAAAL
jgi:NAD(P)-dependent dehydrogenase (short-subunit alcohol dehydrogenase family)